jgi:hypothetical protein
MRIDPTRLRLQISVLAAMSAVIVAMFITSDIRAPIVITMPRAARRLVLLPREPAARARRDRCGPAAAIDRADDRRPRNPAAVGTAPQADRGRRRRRSLPFERADQYDCINGQVLAEVFDKDREGRPLPSWEGCIRLVDGEFFLLQPHPYSFDSRYFGPVMRCDILGVARPLWTWNPDQ